MKTTWLLILLLLVGAGADERPRARELGLKPGLYQPGPNNAITDVAGVLVGQVTLVRGEGKLVPGQGPVRTGVTAILPCADPWTRRFAAGTFILNGNGEMTGLAYLDDMAWLETPILLTNTLNVGKVADACIEWLIEHHPEIGVEDDVPIPVVAECDDSTLNDIQGRHVGPAEVKLALDGARSGPVQEGACGGGTGMIAYGYKAGTGTSSRVTPGGYTVGVLVQANMGDREEFTVLGRPVGKLLEGEPIARRTEGSIVFVVATDAPLNASQLRRLARHTAHGLARTGAITHNGSGDLAIAFSTRNAITRNQESGELPMVGLSNASLNPLYQATVEATEEAILNALCKAQTTTGRDGVVAPAVPLERLRALLP
ncbi:MAG: P1 family peptidase [Vulcanimicrobiota bacterium]